MPADSGEAIGFTGDYTRHELRALTYFLESVSARVETSAGRQQSL